MHPVHEVLGRILITGITHAWQVCATYIYQREGCRSRTARRLGAVHAAKLKNLATIAASEPVEIAPDVEATAAELAAKKRADSVMDALLAEVSRAPSLPRFCHGGSSSLRAI